MTGGLSFYEGLTVRLTLPEGYFVGASSNFDGIMILKMVIAVVFVFISYSLWNKYGNDDMVVDTVEFYPPEGMNCADVAYAYKGFVNRSDSIPFLIHLANKGYLKIEENKKGKDNSKSNSSFNIVKLKEYDGDDINEWDFLMIYLVHGIV